MPSLAVPEGITALLFDLDGVLTRTARVHRAAWKEMFDAFLESAGDDRPFTDGDYAAHVDGRLRQDGVRAFLGSRGIELPEGAPDDPTDRETVHGLGNRKDVLFREVLDRDGVETYDGSVRFVRDAVTAGFRTAVVSASRNCRAVLDAAGIADLFEVRVDGEVAASRHLPGKPAPDTFLAAADALGAAPDAAAVFEDAVAGVQAGVAGGFGLVVGVDREGHPERLAAAGAHRVVGDLGELRVAG